MRHGEAIRLRALMVVAERRDLDVQWEDHDYEQRYLRRWYSKQFSTPLDEVAGIPDHDILVAYWEEHYESLDEEGLEEALEEVLSTRELIDKKKAKAREDAEFMRRVEEEVARSNGIMSRRRPTHVERVRDAPPKEIPEEIPEERIEFAGDDDPIDFRMSETTQPTG